jgi:hypothetical protein
LSVANQREGGRDRGDRSHDGGDNEECIHCLLG